MLPRRRTFQNHPASHPWWSVIDCCLDQYWWLMINNLIILTCRELCFLFSLYWCPKETPFHLCTRSTTWNLVQRNSEVPDRNHLEFSLTSALHLGYLRLAEDRVLFIIVMFGEVNLFVALAQGAESQKWRTRTKMLLWTKYCLVNFIRLKSLRNHFIFQFYFFNKPKLLRHTK